MKLKHHLFRIISAIVLGAGFIYALVNTVSWILICLECIVAAFLCGLIIAIDSSHEMPDDY